MMNKLFTFIFCKFYVSLGGPEGLGSFLLFLAEFCFPKTLFSTSVFSMGGKWLMATLLLDLSSFLANHSSSNLKHGEN